MIEVEITSLDICRALLLEEQQQFRNKFTIRKKNSLYIGILGEVLYEKLFEGAVRINNFNYDFLYRGRKIDVKTKECKFKPKPHYSATVEAYTRYQQKCEAYVFFRIRRDHKVAWLLGSKNKSTFFKHAKFYKKGDTAPGNGLIYKEDHYGIPISWLDGFKFCKV